MMVAVMTIIGTTASFGNTDGRHRHNGRHCHNTTACCNRNHCDIHRQSCCYTTNSTYCTASSKHRHKLYKNSNVCKYCKKHVCTVQHNNTPARRRTFK